MVTTRTRLKADGRIAALQDKIKAIKEAQRKSKRGKKEITRESEGVANLLTQLEAIAKANKVKKPLLIRVISKLTRSGFKFAE